MWKSKLPKIEGNIYSLIGISRNVEMSIKLLLSTHHFQGSNNEKKNTPPPPPPPPARGWNRYMHIADPKTSEIWVP